MLDTDEMIVNMHSSMLLVGAGATNYCLKEISYGSNYEEVLKNYGESDISNAFKIAADMGVTDIFILNLRSSRHYLEVEEVIKHCNFSYIVPVSVYMSDLLTDIYRDNYSTSYIAYLLALTSVKFNESVIIATDKHASLYENIDAFLEGQKAEDIFRKSCGRGMKYENIVFTANNLKDSKYSNVNLAAALCVKEIYEYPEYNFGEAEFDIDKNDKPGCWAYFKNHVSEDTTVENLLNFLPSGAEKIVFISRIIKMIKRELEFNEYVGKKYSEYIRLKIHQKLDRYLNSLVGTCLYKYRINSVEGYSDTNNKGCVIVETDSEIWPVNCIESCHLTREIEI